MLQHTHLWPYHHSRHVNTGMRFGAEEQRIYSGAWGLRYVSVFQLSQCSLAFYVTKVGFLFQKFKSVIITVNSTSRKEAPWEQSVFICSDEVEPVWIYSLLDMEVLPLLRRYSRVDSQGQSLNEVGKNNPLCLLQGSTLSGSSKC